jgi:hypothetical protein
MITAIRTLIPQLCKVYSSFPTFTEHRGKIFVFYRQALKNSERCHGFDGMVKCFEIETKVLLDAIRAPDCGDLHSYGQERLAFGSGNEFDAIVSKLDKNLYSLATRSYLGKGTMKTYLSFSNEPFFKERTEIDVPGLEWLVFYGKAFRWEESFVFPAYGLPEGHHRTRPFLILTRDLSRFEVLSWLVTDTSLPPLNETSIIYDGERYQAFIRGGTVADGIWSSYSTDLVNWATPEEEIPNAHAPMAIHRNGVNYLSYRDLSQSENTSISLKTLPDNIGEIVDTYEGNPYDGGYSDIRFVDDKLFIVYYSGNTQGEPSIKLGISVNTRS